MSNQRFEINESTRHKAYRLRVLYDGKYARKPRSVKGNRMHLIGITVLELEINFICTQLHEWEL